MWRQARRRAPHLTRLHLVSGLASYLAVLGWIATVVAVALDAAVGPGSTHRAGASQPAARPLPPARPLRLEIPAIGVDSPLAAVAKDARQGLQLPPITAPPQAGWYRLGPSPGAAGSAVIVGHVDGRRGPAVFNRLRSLRPGDLARVRRGDGRTAVFRIDTVERVRRDRFPTAKVYAPVPYAGIRLITSAGRFDPAAGGYADNVIAYGHLSRG